MLPWKTIAVIEKTSAQPAYLQVANSIIEQIHRGRLSAGEKLPGARTLGALLHLNRKTIDAAMDELLSQGWIERYAHKGTFISATIPNVHYHILAEQPLAAQKKTKLSANQLSALTPLYLGPGKTIIDDGIPDVRLAPLKTLYAYQRSMLSKKTFQSLLKYNHVEGDIGLRTVLSSYLHNTRGISATPEHIFLTRGSQMGIHLALASLVKPGDHCVTSFPGYQIVDTMIVQLGGIVNHVGVDDEGIRLDELEKICKRKPIRLLYTTPHHHYPTTVALSPTRRIMLLQLAIRYGFYILEDDYAYDFQYDNKPILPLASLSKNDHVIYIGSFTKCLTPLIRIGYFVAPPLIMQAANKLRRTIDRQGDPLLERALGEFIKNGDLQRHLKKVIKFYRHRRDYFCDRLAEVSSGKLHFKKPDGGMSVWITFKSKASINRLIATLAKDNYVLDSDSQFISKLNSIRVGFAAMNEREVERFVGAVKGSI